MTVLDIAGARIVQIDKRRVGVRAEGDDLMAWPNIGLHFSLPGFELALVADLEGAHCTTASQV